MDLMPGKETDVTLRSKKRTIIIDAKYYKEPLKEYYGKFKPKPDNINQISDYLKNMEINSFQKIPHSFNNSNKNSSSIKNPENKVPTKNSNITKELQDNFIDIDKLSSYTGKNIIIHLKDGRKLEGVIIKIIYDIDLIGKKYEVVKFLNSNKKMSINTSLIESVETSK